MWLSAGVSPPLSLNVPRSRRRPIIGSSPLESHRWQRARWFRSGAFSCEDLAVTVPFAAYLRVYEPLAAFSAERAQWWQRYAQEGHAISPEIGPARQRRELYESGAMGTRLPDIGDEAYIIEEDDGILVCPWQIRSRIATAIDKLASSALNLRLARAFISPEIAAESAEIGPGPDTRRIDTEPVWHEHVATWHVPIRWFMCAEATERETVLTNDRRLVRYRIPMARARHRGNKAHAVLRASLGSDNPLTVSARQLIEWLGVFHPRSVVELDYGGLAWVLSPQQLDADDSPQLVHDGLVALARGDIPSAGRAYERLMSQWRYVRLRERSN